MKKEKSRTPKQSFSPPSADLKAELRKFIRLKGAEYLKDPNITSIGIGLKEVDAKSPNKAKEGQLCIQFTVGKKIKNDSVAEIEDLGSSPIPKEINVAGTTIPTDVLQRTYKVSFQVVAEEVSNQQRKIRHDPIQPGLSVGHPEITAGTIGAIVYDLRDGAACILSNWHVLNGRDGNAGDTIVQPGCYDDPHTDLNKAGVLVRSHLGRAGDCAIARIEGRGYDPTVFDLKVKISQIGEPDLGDTVVKSGRTSNVTYGRVRRVDTIAKIDYDGREETIGCFEIGPHPDHPTPDGEVSMGGDSGAAWLAVNDAGKTTDIMVGLHFGGEGQGNPDEHALACYPKSVFNKLEISLAPPVRSSIAVTGETAHEGFKEGFLSKPISFPKLLGDIENDVFKLNNSPHIPYTHFSVCLSKSRHMARFVAWNIDGGAIKKYSRTGLSFKYDDRVSHDLQIGNEAYKDNKLDRGHIARRADLVWGSTAEAKAANRDSFFFTNITPQHQNFNQSERAGLWGQLENAIYDEVDIQNLRLSVLGGPILKATDKVYRGIQIPSEFWKVLVFVENATLKAKAYILSQADYLNDIEAMELDEFRIWQVTLPDLGDKIDFDFGELTAADTLSSEMVHRPEMLRLGGRMAREIVSREDLFRY